MEKEKKKKNVKNKDKEEKEKLRKEETKRYDSQLYIILGVIVGLVAIFFISSLVFKSFNTFEYGGPTGKITFTKERFDELMVYHYYYYFTHNRQTYKYNLYLRNDPRENNVPVEGGEIFLSIKKPAYVSVDGHKLIQCEHSNIAVAGLSAFLTNNLFTVKGATPNIIESQAQNITFATCESKPDAQVIIVQDGEESKVEKISDTCYEITVANCEMLDATEKFIVQAILDANYRPE